MTRAVLDPDVFVAAAIRPDGDALVRDASMVADPAEAPPLSRDRNDDYLIAVAYAAEAHVLVTGDADLLELDLSDLEIASPRRFLELLPR